MNKLLLIFLISTTHLQAQKHLFYLHGRIVEEQGAKARDTVNGYGTYELDSIVKAFRAAGFQVISEVRPKGTNAEQYAAKVSMQIDSLLQAGIPAKAITVVGASKGSYIAMLVSAKQKNPRLNFVLMGACSESGDQQIRLTGRILSIYEASDRIGSSCNKLKEQSPGISEYREVRLSTGLRHGFLYKPLNEWVVPAIEWAR